MGNRIYSDISIGTNKVVKMTGSALQWRVMEEEKSRLEV